MSQVYITAAITSFAALAMWNWCVKRFPPDGQDNPRHFPTRMLWLAFLLCLPLEPLSFVLMRLPLMKLVKDQLPDLFPYLVLAWAPLTEDTFKLLPLLVPSIRRRLNRQNWAQLALAIGFGFGIGEAWLVAWFTAQNPKLNHFPFWYYGGYMGERLQVCILHAFFTSWALRRWKNYFPLGVLTAMAFHLLANSPIVLVRFLPQPQLWLQLYGVLLLVLTGLAAAHLAHAIVSTISLARLLLGRARCPGCGEIYERSFLAANLGNKRYERCPHCKKWHLTGEEHTVKD